MSLVPSILASLTAVAVAGGPRPQTITLAPGAAQALTIACPSGRHVALEVTPSVDVLLQIVDPRGVSRVTRRAGPPDPTTVGLVTDGLGAWALVLETEQAGTVVVRRVASAPATPLDRLVWQADEAADALTRNLSDKDGRAPEELATPTLAAYRAAYGSEPATLATRLLELVARLDWESSGRRKLVARTLLQAGLAALAAGDEAESLAAAGLLDALSDVENARGDWATSERLERQVLAIRASQAGPADPEMGRTLFGIAMPTFDQGRLDEARALAEQARAIESQKAPIDEQMNGDIANLLGEIQRSKGEYRAAEETFRQLLAAPGFSSGGDVDFAATLWNNLAGVYRDQDRYDEARDCLRHALDLWSQCSGACADRVPIGMLNQAELLRLQGRIADSIGPYDTALARARATFDASDPRLVFFLSQKAVAHAALGESREVEALYADALDVAAHSVGLDHPLAAQVRVDRAELFLSAGRAAEAEAELRSALAIRESAFGASHPAVAVAEAALARSLAAQGGTRDDEALACLDRAVAAFGKGSAFPDARAQAWATRSEILERGGRRAEAVEALGRALDVVEALRPVSGGGDRTRAEFLARYRRWYDTMVGWQLAAGRLASAFDFMERSRARVLLEQLAASGVDLLGGVPNDERGRLRERELAAVASVNDLQVRLQAVELRSDLLQEDRDRLEADLMGRLQTAAGEIQEAHHDVLRASPLWTRQLSTAGRVVDLATVRSQLARPDAPVVIYHVGEAESQVLFVPDVAHTAWATPLVVDAEAASDLGVPRGELTAASLRRILGGEEGLLDPSALMRGLQRVRVGAPAPALRTRSQLYALWRILAPPRLWRELVRAKEVVLVPDGVLNRVAFEALVTSARDRDPRYWLDEGPAIRYAPSVTALDAITARGSSGTGSNRVVIVADPVLPQGSAHEGLPALPATRLEAAGIRDAFSGLRPVIDLEGSDATEARVRQVLAEGARYAHFATHGLVDEGTGDTLATLVLSPPQGSVSGAADDGKLQLFEIYDLGLDAELAVLSACDSQVGKVVEGEGVFALSRGFLAGGARRVIASLWPVEDASTAELMRDFYGRLARSEKEGRPVSYSVVLRDAKRRLRNEERWSAPFFWAPLILTGAR